MMQVRERHSRASGCWSVSPGLDAIPTGMAARITADLKVVNGRLGWVKYMVIPYLPPREV